MNRFVHVLTNDSVSVYRSGNTVKKIRKVRRPLYKELKIRLTKSSSADHKTTIDNLVTEIGETEKESHLYYYSDFPEGSPLINISKFTCLNFWSWFRLHWIIEVQDAGASSIIRSCRTNFLIVYCKDCLKLVLCLVAS